jgi:hypothetical protein
MPALNWNTFEALPGDARDNFERLCRAATAYAYARYGRFAARAQQPGVEFHLNIDRPGCALGDPGRWYGWQSKWWDVQPGRAIRTTRRNDVLDSIEKTKQHVPGITDWVLWTRRPLTDGDQEWFYGLQAGMQLHLWTEAELDGLLIGDAALLREAYFGSLILTPERLIDQQARAAAEAGERWTPEVHQASPAERRLRRMLAEPEAWDDLQDNGREIGRWATAVGETTTRLDAALASDVETIIIASREVAEVLKEAHGQLWDGRSTTLVGVGRRTVPPAPPAKPLVLRRLRARQHPAALPLTNLIAHVREAAALAEHVEGLLMTRFAVVTGDAGFGKTQLAATLSAPTGTRPAGVLLYGRRLTTRGTLDDLAGQLTVAGAPVATFEALLAAVDAAAARAGCRLPIVIDGLNEAEAATTWAPLLRRLLVTLERYPSVLVVCTVREAFLADAVPNEVRDILTLDGFDEDLDEAIARYFAHYKIEPGDAELPRELLDHPLSLKIYCSVANPSRKDPVSVERLPGSLTGMFDDYITAVCRRVYELNPSIHPRDVTLALDALGSELWNSRAREVSEERARELFEDGGRRWRDSLLAALEHEGVVIRHPDDVGRKTVALVYDLLAGHVIATSLLHSHGAGIAQLLSADSTPALFAGEWEDRHPLAGDIFDALAGTMPRAGAGQLWQVVTEPLRLSALLRAAGLEADHLDTATVDALAANVDALKGRGIDVFDRLHSTRAGPRHPLNARFLNRVLLDRPVADRDLRWSEWLRTHARRLRADAAVLAMRWRNHSERSEADRLRARWMMWTLTSTDRTLRDAATAALYWYGRHEVDGLFSLAIEAIAINDAYVGQRVVAAAYGVATANQLHGPTFEAALSSYLQALLVAFTGADAATPTFDALIRYYASGTVDFARRYYPAAVPAAATAPLTFAAGPAVDPLRDGDARREEVLRTLRMDFGNYTLGRLFPDRRNYDASHPGHRDATDHVLGVVHALGWRSDPFAEVDRRIEERPRYERDGGRLERYGKKYGWIGFYTMTGMLADRGQYPEWLEVDIDPTFPQPLRSAPVQLATWARRTPADDRRWLRDGVVRVPDGFLVPAELDEDEGPWVLVHAEIDVKDVATGRSTFGLFNTVLVDQADLVELLEVLDASGHPGRDMIDLPAEYYLFAGEVPWHDRFASPEPGHSVNDLYRDYRGRRQVELRVEKLAHHFAWEPHHSGENQVNAYVPSRSFSEAFDLRSIPAGFDQVEPSGALAARSFSAPAGFKGGLLYLRGDLLWRYADGRPIVTFGWGERQTQLTWPEKVSSSLQKLYAEHRNVWRMVKVH